MKKIPKIRRLIKSFYSSLNIKNYLKKSGKRCEILVKEVLESTKKNNFAKTFQEKKGNAKTTGFFDVGLLRGMMSYAVIWPTCCFIQEYLEYRTPIWNADWWRAVRFSGFGTFFMAPLLHYWIKFSGRWFKTRCLKGCLTRAAVEQVTYGPFAMSYFFFGMAFLEGKSIDQCINIVKEKFWPTYRVGFFYWPAVQTLNFYLLPDQYRIMFVSLASLVWTVYMAHMQMERVDKTAENKI